MYGLPKVHKKCINGSPPFRPILSAIGISTYNLAQFLVTLLSPLTSNDFTVKDSFTFAEDIRSQDQNLYMATLDVDSLFTNLPLDETIDICVSLLFKDSDVVNGLTKEDVHKLLNIATKESFFMFDKCYYKQTDGVAMGSPLGPTLANIFLCHHEKLWLDQCPIQFKPLYYRRYVDDIFLLFSSKEHIESFRTYMNSRHNNLTFSKETKLMVIYHFWMLKYFVKMVRLSPLFIENLLSVVFTPILPALCLRHINMG